MSKRVMSVLAVLVILGLYWSQSAMALKLSTFSKFGEHWSSISITHSNLPRQSVIGCQPSEPFKCPMDQMCLSLQYLCDGVSHCSDGFDEDSRLCTAAKRPPVNETRKFLQSMLDSEGEDYLEKLFGSKARHSCRLMGGVRNVATVLSESQTIDDFGATMYLSSSDLEHLRSILMATDNGDMGMLKSLDIDDSHLSDITFLLRELINTGFI